MIQEFIEKFFGDGIYKKNYLRAAGNQWGESDLLLLSSYAYRHS